MIIEKWFPTPIGYLFDLELAQEALPLAEEVLSSEENLNKELSSKYGPQSRITLNKTDSAQDVRLRNINTKLCNYSKRFLKENGYNSDISIENSKIYFNNLKYGGSQLSHQHENCPVTGIVYLNVDDNSAPLRISTPLLISDFVFRSKVEVHNEITTSVVSHKAETGKVIIFPGWVTHSVPTNYTDNRIVLTFLYYYT